jgi:hypothetical protein
MGRGRLTPALARGRKRILMGDLGEFSFTTRLFLKAYPWRRLDPGSITAPGRFVRDTVPQAANWLTGDGVDVALLVPV